MRAIFENYFATKAAAIRSRRFASRRFSIFSFARKARLRSAPCQLLCLAISFLSLKNKTILNNYTTPFLKIQTIYRKLIVKHYGNKPALRGESFGVQHLLGQNSVDQLQF